MIAVGLTIGITKQELLNDYAFDELLLVCDESAALRGGKKESTADEW